MVRNGDWYRQQAERLLRCADTADMLGVLHDVDEKTVITFERRLGGETYTYTAIMIGTRAARNAAKRRYIWYLSGVGLSGAPTNAMETNAFIEWLVAEHVDDVIVMGTSGVDGTSLRAVYEAEVLKHVTTNVDIEENLRQFLAAFRGDPNDDEAISHSDDDEISGG